MSMTSVASGAIALALLDGLVSRPAAAKNVGGALAAAGNAVNWFLSPQVPAFKDTSSVAKASTVTPGAIAGSAAGTTSNPPIGQGGFADTTVPPALSPTGTSTGEVTI